MSSAERLASQSPARMVGLENGRRKLFEGCQKVPLPNPANSAPKVSLGMILTYGHFPGLLKLKGSARRLCPMSHAAGQFPVKGA